MPDKIPDLSAAFGLAPADAIAWFEAKGYAITWSWRDQWQEIHARAFTAAGVMQADVLADLKGGIGKALAQGGTERDFKRAMQAVLEQKGWWGKAARIDKSTGEMTGKGLTPRRLETIFRTNVQSAYMAGRYRQQLDNAADRPYWMYVAILDGRTRPRHRSLNGRVFRHDDPLWATHYPPNGYRCRCRVRALDAAELAQEGIALSASTGKLTDIEVPTSQAVNAPKARVTRFELSPGHDFAPDPGWSYNPGAAAMTPFTPPPLDTLPRTFPQGVALPALPPSVRFKTSPLLPTGQPPEDYARAFLSKFGADIGRPVIFEDVARGSLVIDDGLFQDGAGNWKADKRGRGPYMPLLAETIKDPAEIWLRWEESYSSPGTWILKRRYLQTFEIVENGESVFGIGSFESGKDGWSGSTVFHADADTVEKRIAYLQRQRDGFLLYQKR